MSATTGKGIPVGLRRAQVFALDTNGYPAATSTTVYEGLQIVGAKAFTLNEPDARIIVHPGDDGVVDTDMLPPEEAVSGELRAARSDMDVYALLTGTSVVTINEAKIVGVGTSKQGYEPEVGLMMAQQMHDENGARNWLAYLMSKARVHAKQQGMQAQASDYPFQIVPSKVSKYLWGVSFAIGTEGFSKAFLSKVQTQYFPWLVAWKGDNSATKFSFHADRPAVSTAKIHAVWINGVADATVVKAVDGVTPTVKPGASDMIVCLYEIANPNEG